jgi:hypothetical protein
MGSTLALHGLTPKPNDLDFPWHEHTLGGLAQDTGFPPQPLPPDAFSTVRRQYTAGSTHGKRAC